MYAVVVMLAIAAGDCGETVMLVESAACVALISSVAVAAGVKLSLGALILICSQVTFPTFHCFIVVVVTFISV